jgi:hypothetical protein
MFGVKHSESTKAKISIKVKGENNPRFGAIVSEETKALISAAKSKGIVETAVPRIIIY